jgi:N6-L-threonylcarbamoyladenine synthase
MIILGIETSCDDTGVAVIRASGEKKPVFEILSNVVSSQIKTHAKFGGVVPNLAAREHVENIEPCLKQALKETNLKPSNIDLIAVTIGPGLIPSLLIGVHFAKALAYKFNKPIVGVNHIEGHIVSAFARTSAGKPAIALIVSGGHTQLVLVKGIKKYKIIGETLDDAAGECFDKVAKLLNLGYPGGPRISEQTEKFKNKNSDLKFPRPMIDRKNYDFSFSGLKTAVLYATQKMEKINIPEVCSEAQQAIIDVLINKTLRAAEQYKAKTIILAGGVAANKELREQMAKTIKKQIPNAEFLIPNFKLCTDNGAMIAMAGYFNRNKATKKYGNIEANANLRIS